MNSENTAIEKTAAENRGGEPLISVVMPSYNSAATIEKAIMSVLGQSYPYTEVVVVDNSSADATAETVRRMISRFPDRIRLIVQENRGVSSARNAGIRAAAGEYFVSLDADDYYEPETVRTLYDALIADGSDTVLCGMRKVYPAEISGDGKDRNEDFVPARAFSGTLKEFVDSEFTELYDLHLIQTHSNQLYKTALIRENGIYYNEELAVNEDIDFVLRYLTACRRISVVRDIFLNYVQHKKGGSLINTFQPHGLKGALIVLDSWNRLAGTALAAGNVSEAMDERLFVHICSFAGLMYYRSGYSGKKILGEIRELCRNDDFSELLKRLKVSGTKNRIAAFLLRNGMAAVYHVMCRMIYRNKD